MLERRTSLACDAGDVRIYMLNGWRSGEDEGSTNEKVVKKVQKFSKKVLTFLTKGDRIYESHGAERSNDAEP